MAEIQSVQPQLFDVAELPGRPMLHWHGKRPLREIPYYPAQLRERYGSAALTTGSPHPSPPGPLSPLRRRRGERGLGEWGEGLWTNRLYWGDNLQVMAHLMREFRGQIKLIYIDPPFDSGADYRKRVKLRGTSLETDLSVLEERQYTDIWSNDLYLQYMYERLILMRELLAEDGSIFLHCDWHRGHLLRCILDEVFGSDNFRNELVVKRRVKKNLQRQFELVQSLPHGHDAVLWYSKNPSARFKPAEMAVRTREEGYWHHFWSNADRPTMRYELLGITPSDGQWKWNRERALQAVKNYERYLQEGRGMSLAEYWEKAGRRLEFIRLSESGKVENWYPPARTRIADTLWLDVHAYENIKDYPTQKHEQLLSRIIEMASGPGDLVADFFIGSGTTAAVAQRLGRRWIGADINLGAIHTTAQRLARIIAEQQNTPYQPDLFSETESAIHNPQSTIAFEVYNVNHYEVFKNAEEARDIVLQLYGVEPLKGHRFFDGTLDSRWVKVVDLNRICSKLDIQTIFDNLPSDDLRGVVVLCAGHEYDVPEAIKRRNLLNVPFEVRDILTDRQDVIFKRPPEAQVRLTRADGWITLTIEQFYSPLLLQKLTLEEDPASTALRPFGFAQGRLRSGQGSAQGESIEDWRQTVASVLVDPAYDGQVFHARITDTPARRDELVRGEYTWEAGKYGDGPVAVKIVDVLDEEWFGVMGREEGDGREGSGNPGSLRERYQSEIERVVTILQEHYAPDKVVLFGSCGRGDFGEDSDVDLLIVKETSKRPLDRMREVYELIYSPDHYLALDPLVYTPTELAQRLASGDFFVREIMQEGKVLYERK